MKKLFSIFAFLSLAVGFTACETAPDVNEPENHDVVLSVNKQKILADGTDSVTFAVTVDGVNVSSDIQIINLNDNSVIEGATGAKFSTTTAGVYRFMAVYKGVYTSEAVTIEAKSVAGDEPNDDPNDEPAAKVVLVADKSEIVADDTDVVTFTVTVDGQDKSAEAKIVVTNYNIELEGNTFTSDVAGEFIFEATYGGVKSEQVKVTAKAVETPEQKSLTLKASKLRIKADGTDSTTFTVLYGEEDVTAKCEFKAVAGQTIEGSVFTTTEVGTYNVYALYNDTRSNTVSIDAYDPTISTAYEIGQIYEVNGAKGVAYAIKKDNHDITWAYFFSMDEADLQWSTENVWCNCIASRGDWNTDDMLKKGSDKYPAAQWCRAHGDGWFMPSSAELQWMWDAISGGTHRFDSESVEAYNKLLTDNGGMPFVSTYYMSSNETADDLVELIAFMNDSVVCLDPLKTSVFTVRAVTRVQLD